MDSTSERKHLIKLRHILATRFSEEELRALCFDLGVDYDSLPGEGTVGKATQLVAHYERRNAVSELAKRCFELRPDAKEDLETKKVAIPPQLVQGFKIQAMLTIIVVSVMIIGVVIVALVQSYLSGKSSVKATPIAQARLTDTPYPTTVIARTSTALATRSTPSDTPRPTLIFPTRTAIVAVATTTSTGRTWQNWTQVQSFPAPAAKPSLIVRQGDILWVAAGSRLYQLSLGGDIISEMKSPGYCANAAWDGETLWCGSASSVYRRGLASEQQLVSFTVDIDPIVGLAWNGEALWVIDKDGNLARYDKTGQRLKRLAVSAHVPEVSGLLWVEGELWVVDIFNWITRFDSNFNNLGWFVPCGASFPSDVALFWDGASLWVTDSNTNRISQCTPSD